MLLVVRKALLRTENAVCKRFHINLQEYYDELKFKEELNDKYYIPFKGRHVVKRTKLLNSIIEKAAHGIQPTIRFRIPKELTKEKVLNAYKLIMSSHAHIQYKAIKNLNSKVTQGQLQAIQSQIDEFKKARR